jgi:hypothetical protein
MIAWLGCLALGLLSCHGDPRRYNVLLITVDTLRADRPHFAGNPRPTTPALDSLAADGVVFPVSYSQAGWTLPSLASIFTGHHPKDHKATDFLLPIAASLPTMPEILAVEGYETRGYVSHILLDQGTGFARGFGEYDSSVLEMGNPHKISSSGELTDRALGCAAYLACAEVSPHRARSRWTAHGERDRWRVARAASHLHRRHPR